MSVARDGQELVREVESGWARYSEYFARFGYVTRGVLYVAMGILAARVGQGLRAESADSMGSMRAIAEEPFGRVLLALVAAGLGAFALWRIVQAVIDSDGHGRSAKAIAKRVVLGFTGLLYAPLAIAAARLLSGDGPASEGADQARKGFLLAWRYGPLAVGVIALLILVVGLTEIWIGVRASFAKEMDLGRLSSRARSVVRAAGRVGFGAHGAILTTVGIFLAKAAFESDPSSATGIDGALVRLANGEHGQAIVTAMGCGLIAFGAFSFLMARYRRAPEGAR